MMMKCLMKSRSRSRSFFRVVNNRAFIRVMYCIVCVESVCVMFFVCIFVCIIVEVFVCVKSFVMCL